MLFVLCGFAFQRTLGLGITGSTFKNYDRVLGLERLEAYGFVGVQGTNSRKVHVGQNDDHGLGKVMDDTIQISQTYSKSARTG